MLTRAAYLDRRVASNAHYIRLTRNVLMRYAYPYVGYAHALMGMCAHVRPTLGL